MLPCVFIRFLRRVGITNRDFGSGRAMGLVGPAGSRWDSSPTKPPAASGLIPLPDAAEHSAEKMSSVEILVML